MEDVEDQLEQEQRDDDEAAKVLFIVHVITPVHVSKLILDRICA